LSICVVNCAGSRATASSPWGRSAPGGATDIDVGSGDDAAVEVGDVRSDDVGVGSGAAAFEVPPVHPATTTVARTTTNADIDARAATLTVGAPTVRVRRAALALLVVRGAIVVG
jgi:hypothetical protein